MHIQIGSICRIDSPKFAGKFSICKVKTIRAHYDGENKTFSGYMIFVELLQSGIVELVDAENLIPTGSNLSANDFGFFRLQADELRAA